MTSSKLEEWRNSIDNIDKEIVSLLAERFRITEEIGIYKAENKIGPQDKIRESEKFQRIVELAKIQGMKPEYAINIYRSILDTVITRHNELNKTLE